MAESTRQDFEALWQESIRLPAHKEVSLEKIKVDLSITDLMDRYLLFSKQAVAQGQMKSDLLEKLTAQTEAYKEALSSIDNDLIQQLARKHINRLLGKD
ncbi:MAG: hypothetical protein M0P70_06905 [Desulfobulbaceae bacterium]|nr:hypothetical protein [Desulfobulbaceae bacterium]